MDTEIQSCKTIKGMMEVPGDKSISHRSVLLGAIAEGNTEISNFLMGGDCVSTINCLRNVGINIRINDNNVVVYGKGFYGLKSSKNPLNSGNSGTTMRLLSGILSGQYFNTILTGDESLIKRPMDRIIEPLTLMGAKISASNGIYAPLRINGSRLNSINYQSKIASAQIKSSVMLASLYGNDKTVYQEPVQSRDHTERMLSAYGGDIEVDHNTITIKPVQKLIAQKIQIPGDISSAAYFIVAALIIPGSEILIKNVGVNPTRTGIIDVLTDMGGKINMYNLKECCGEPIADLSIKYSNLKGTIIKGSLIPRLIDEIPILAIAASFSTGETIIKDAQELKIKESNRINTVTSELSKLGIEINAIDDGMIIKGNEGDLLNGGITLDSHNDHRIAMACCIAALKCRNRIKITNSDCMGISFPNFLEVLNSITY